MAKLQQVLESNKKIKNVLEQEGWEKRSVGESYRIDYNKRFDLYIRRRNLRSVMNQNTQTFEKCLGQGELENQHKYSGFGMVSNTHMGVGYTDLTPKENVNSLPDATDLSLPVLSSFKEYPSLLAARTHETAQVVAFDAEWFFENGDETTPREILSWQFSTVFDTDLVEFVFLRKHEKFLLTLEIALGRIMDYLSFSPIALTKVRGYKALAKRNRPRKNGNPDEVVERWFSSKEEALKSSIKSFDDGDIIKTASNWDLVDSIPVVLLCHTGRVDISTLDQTGAYQCPIMHYCSDVHGGLVTLRPKGIQPKSLNPIYSVASNNNPHAYPITLQIADTLCHAPADKRSLKALGSVIGWDKVVLEDSEIGGMNKLLMDDPVRYFHYASTDSTVTLLYAAALYGYNQKLPVTVTSAGANVMKNAIMTELGCKTRDEYERKYRGLYKVVHGAIAREHKPGYIEQSSWEPISDQANTVQNYASKAYHGGYNSSSDIGYYPFITYDYDLQNAYPTAMCMVPDVDWENPIRTEIKQRELTISDFTSLNKDHSNPLTLMVAYVRFEFPEDVMYPCIPVNIDGCLVYPRTSEGVEKGVYAAGPELYLALMLGAKVFCETGYILNPLIDQKAGSVSYSLRSAVLQLVSDRLKAKKKHGKGSLEELILKMMVNAGYGKTAQNVVQKQTWSAYDGEMKNIGGSVITNPVSACMTTSIVRAVLLAAQNQCTNAGYMTCSVTTDGFISDVPDHLLKSMDLYGIRKCMESSRLFLTDGKDPEIWEIKHVQDDLVNYTTRGNVSLYWKADDEDHASGLDGHPFDYKGTSYAGVCAHNGCKSGFKSDGAEDRLWLMRAVLGRTGTVDYVTNEWTSFRDMEQGTLLSITPVTKHLRMDYDMKRKPVRASFKTCRPVVDGVAYEIANFSTVPFEDAAEYLEYRKQKSNTSCLRTMNDWERFWRRIDHKNMKAKPRNMEWSILDSCIRGYRAGLWSIPALDALKGDARYRWINDHNESDHVFTGNDWKNAGRTKRQAGMLPVELLMDKLTEMGAVIKP